MELQDYKYEQVQTKEGEKDEIFTVSYLELFKYSTLLDKFLIFSSVWLTILTGIANTMLSLTFGKATGALVAYVYTTENNGTSQEMMESAGETLKVAMQWFGIVTTTLGAIILVGTYLVTVFLNYTALNQTFRIRKLFFSRVLNQDISWFDQNQTGDFSSRIADDLKKIEDGLGEKFGILIFHGIIFISSLIQAFVTGWELALICMIQIPVSSVTMGFVSSLSSKFTKQETEAYGKAGSIAEEVLTSIRTVVAFGGQTKEEERYKKILLSAGKINIKRSLFNGVSNAGLSFFFFAGFSLTIWYGVKLVIKNRGLPIDEVTYDAGNIITVIYSILNAQWYFGMTTPYIDTFAVAKGAAAKIFQVIATEPVLNKSRGRGKKPKGIDGKITFEDVHFNYPSRKDVKILKGFNLTIKPGETVALVGGSGCGKSTCIQLLQRFYDPDSGFVYIDDNRMTDLDLDWLRSHIGVVGQEPILFEATISDNIRYGYLDATQDEIEAAAKKANADSFITALPNGYLTVLGERGAQLSGGQKQRIAIARALVRNPAILLLDEATSALDTKSERVVQSALDSATHGCTTVLVAHRLSTVRKADRIIVIVDGQLQEEGTHETLMLAKGAYYNLVVAQCKDTEKTEDGIIRSIEPDERKDVLMQEKNHTFKREKNSLQIDDLDIVQKSGSPETSSSLWAIMKYNSPEWWIIAIGCLTSIVTGATMPVYAILFGDILGVLADEDVVKVQTEVNMFSLMILSVGIIMTVCTLLKYYTFGVAGEKLTMRMRTLMFNSILKQEMGWFDEKGNGVGAICVRLSADAASLQGATGQRIGTMLTSATTLLISIIASYYYEWRVALVASCFVPLLIFSVNFEQKILEKQSNSYYKALQKSTQIAVEAINGIRTIASLGCEHIFQDMYVKELTPYQITAKRNTHIRGIVYGLSRSLMVFAYTAAYCYGAKLVKDKSCSYAHVFIVAECLIASSNDLGTTLAFAPNFSEGLIAASRIIQLINRTPKIVDGSQNITEKWASGNLHYKNVFFSYPNRPSVTVLKDLNLSVLKDKMVALVGPSGCGKSTIVQLLQRFYDPTSGSITADEQEIKTMNLTALRSHMGVVSQEPNLFSKTIADNIAYGDNSRTVSREEIINAAKQANIHTFITSLPLGYETKLGEKGTQLSGGQKQRVAIARALVRNPEVLLLDEATSALDAESEKVVKEALDNAKVGRTCIAIAHRLTTIQDADIICVINNGQIVELGTHVELLNNRGFYYNLYTLQNYK